MDHGEKRYTKEHEWAVIQEGIAMIGITEYAQKQLGDVVFVELPRMGRKLEQGEVFGVVESVKAVSDLFAPLSGEIIEVNQALSSSPQLINSDPYHEGWVMKVKIVKPEEQDGLLTEEEYEAHLKGEGK